MKEDILSVPARTTSRKSATIGDMLGASLAAACFATAGASSAYAQNEIVLPTVNVETTEEAPAAPATPRRTTNTRRAAAPAAPQTCTPELAGTPVCAAQEAAEAQAAAEAAAAARAEALASAGTNPFADPDAPFKADTLSNSKLPGQILDTPRTVTAITKEVLDTTGVREIARSTPGISLGFGEGGNSYGDNLYIRGFKANNDIYLDGVRDPGISVHETFATEQVEIVKGPASTVGGRGTAGGALDVVSKKPQDVDFNKVTTEMTSAGTKRATADVNRVVNDRFAYRLNGMWQDGEVAGRDGVEDDRLGVALATRYKATDQLTLEFDYSYTELEGKPDWGVPYIGTRGPVTSLGVDRDTWYGLADRDFQKTTQSVGTARAKYEFDNGMSLTNTLRKSSSVLDYMASVPSGITTNGSTDPDDWLVAVSNKSVYQETDVLSNTLELGGEQFIAGRKHTLAFGLTFSQEDVRKFGYDNLTSEDYQAPTGIRGCAVSATNPDQEAAGCWTGQDPERASDGTTTGVRTRSAYIMDTVELNTQWQVNGGLRVDEYEITRESGSGTSATKYERTDTMWNWNAGVVFKPAENLSFYGAAATSTTPMGSEIASGGGFYGGLDESGQDLKPEQSLSLELGAKYQFNDDLLLTAALFQTTRDNAREDIGPRGSAVTSDTLKYKIEGLELGVAGRVGEKVGLFGGATWMRSEVLESDDDTNVGRNLANIAHAQFNLLGTYDITDGLMLGLRANFQGEKDLGGTVPNGKELPEAWTWDLVGSYDITDAAEVRFGVTNLTDVVYYDTAYRSGDPFTYVAPGREFSVAVDFRF